MLVIHGIGEQNPFETLDMFARTLWDVLDPRPQGARVDGRHAFKVRDGWTEHYLTLVRADTGEPVVDLHEYYWAYQMEEQIAFPELVDWLLKASDGARKYYAENEELRQKYEARGRQVKPRWYLRHVGWALRGLGFLRSLGVSAIPHLDWLIRGLMQPATRLVVDYVGDVALYTTMDVKSKRYQIRSRILEESVKLLKGLLEEYDRIVVVGHSLGSVIAFDTLNLVNLAMNTGAIPPDQRARIIGLVTFGSPLDKIAFFFREHTPDDQSLRRQILAHLHSFKGRDLDFRKNARVVANPIATYLEHVRWLNFWDPEDPVSGHLDFYDIPDKDNVRYDMHKPWGVAHLGYWTYRPMYERIAHEFLPA
jgi:hypothetical protein